MAHRISRYKVSVIREASSIFNYSPKIRGSFDAKEWCKDALKDYAQEIQEHFIVVALDTQHKPIGYSIITIGTLDASLVHPREVFRYAIAQSAASIILVHNHPSGHMKPSKEDFAVTNRLRQVGEIVGINVLDHIILGWNTEVEAISLGEELDED